MTFCFVLYFSATIIFYGSSLPLNLICDNITQIEDAFSLADSDMGPLPLVLVNSSANDGGIFFSYHGSRNAIPGVYGRISDHGALFTTNSTMLFANQTLLSDSNGEYPLWGVFQFDNTINLYYAAQTPFSITYVSYDMTTSSSTYHTISSPFALEESPTIIKSIHMPSSDKYVFMRAKAYPPAIYNIIVNGDGTTVHRDVFEVPVGEKVFSPDVCTFSSDINTDYYLQVWRSAMFGAYGRIMDSNAVAISGTVKLSWQYDKADYPSCSGIYDEGIPMWIICWNTGSDVNCSKWNLDLSSEIISAVVVATKSYHMEMSTINYVYNHVISCMFVDANGVSLICVIMDKNLNVMMSEWIIDQDGLDHGSINYRPYFKVMSLLSNVNANSGNEFFVTWKRYPESYVRKCSYTTLVPTAAPTNEPTVEPTSDPTAEPTLYPTTKEPTNIPTLEPTKITIFPTVQPTDAPTSNPSYVPSVIPTHTPSIIPSVSPSSDPTNNPSSVPTLSPIDAPLKIEASTTMLTSIIVCGFAAFIVIVICIIYIFKNKILLRAQEMGNATMMNLFKELELMEKVSFVMEVFDIITDYLFAVQLITMENTVNAEVFGWISLISAIFGLILFNIKFLLMKKLIGFQIPKLKNDIKTLTNTQQIISKMEQIRTRRSDIDVISLLMALVEDLPQTMIVILVVTSDIGWGYYSIFNFSLSLIGFCLKCIQVILTKYGCKDQMHLTPGHSSNNGELEMKTVDGATKTS